MNFTRALGLGVVLYIILFLIDNIVMYLLGFPYMGQVVVFTTPLFCVPLAYIYLREAPEKQMLEGFKLGFCWVLISIVIDIPVFVYLFGLGWEHFSSILVWLAYLEIIFFNSIIGGLVEGTT
jgi:hypothetical protein